MLLSMALWKAVADRHDLLVATWDSGRVGQAEQERLSTLVWGRLDATRHLPAGGDGHRDATGALAVSLPEACRLSDALAASLRARLGVDASEADTTARIRQLRAAVERVRDLVDREPASAHDAGAAVLAKLDTRVSDAMARAQRGADTGGLIGPLESDVARAERDLIVGAANRRAEAHDAARARALREELEARGVALRDLAALCVAEVTPAPRFAVPDVSALGRVPTEPDAVDAYLVRLDAVGRAMTMAQDAYAAALAERDELSGRLEGYAAKAGALGVSSSSAGDLADLQRRTTESSTPSPPTSSARAPSSRRTRPTWPACSRSEPSDSTEPRRHAMTACTQPGCTGNILDGYCDVCGSPAAQRRARQPRATVRGTHRRDRRKVHPARLHAEPSSTATATCAALPAAAAAATRDTGRRRARPPRPSRAHRTGSPPRPWARRAPRPAAPRSPAASAPPPPGCAAPGWVPG